MMKIAYIAGPYRGKTKEDIEKNIRDAEQIAQRFWKMGHAVICPHMNSAHFDGIVPDKNFLNGDKEILKRLIPGVDFVVLMIGWKNSAGARAEAELAANLGLRIIDLDALENKQLQNENKQLDNKTEQAHT